MTTPAPPPAGQPGSPITEILQYVVTQGSQLLSVKDYGAKGDGSTNDTAAIQAALTAAGNAGGGVVLLPPGTYLAGGLGLPSGVTLRGSGIGASVIKMTGGADAAIYNASFRTYAQGQPDPSWAPREDNIGVEELTIDGQKTTNTNRYGIIIRPASHVRVRRVRVINTQLQGIMIQHCAGVDVEGCVTSGTSADGIMVSDCVRFRVANNTVEDSGDYGIEVGAGYDYGSPNSPAATAATDGTVVGNVVRNCTNYGICLRGYKNATANPGNRLLRRVTVTGNSVTGCGGAGLGVQELVDDYTFAGNTSAGNLHGLTITVGGGSPANGQRGVVTGNMLNDNTQNGVNGVTVQGVIFAGNTITGNGTNGYSASTADCAFLGNVIRNNSVTTSGAADNLSLLATSQNVEVRGNDLQDHGTRTARYDLNGNAQTGITPKGNAIGTTNGLAFAPDLNTQATNTQTLAAGAGGSVDPRTGGVQILSLTGSQTAATYLVPGTPVGTVVTIEYRQDATGGRAYTWPTACKFAGGAAPAASTLAGYSDSVTFRMDSDGYLHEISRSVGVR